MCYLNLECVSTNVRWSLTNEQQKCQRLRAGFKHCYDMAAQNRLQRLENKANGTQYTVCQWRLFTIRQHLAHQPLPVLHCLSFVFRSISTATALTAVNPISRTPTPIAQFCPLMRKHAIFLKSNGGRRAYEIAFYTHKHVCRT